MQVQKQSSRSSPQVHLEPQRYLRKIHHKTRHTEATKAREQATIGGNFTTIRNRGRNRVFHRFRTENRPRQYNYGNSTSIYWLEIRFQISRIREQGYLADSQCQRLPHGCDGSQASGPWAIDSGYRFRTTRTKYTTPPRQRTRRPRKRNENHPPPSFHRPSTQKVL